MKHDPAPWEIGPCAVITHGGIPVATVHEMDEPRGKANARLMVTAPDMFLFLCGCADEQSGCSAIIRSWARSLLNQCTGADVEITWGVDMGPAHWSERDWRGGGEYGPYKVLAPKPGSGPTPTWRVVGPGVELSALDPKFAHFRASEAHAIYRAGVAHGQEAKP